MPYFVGAYVAVSWGLVQAVDWIVDRYALSGHLVDLSLTLFLLLLPTAAMLAWRHGAPGRNRWTRVEKIGVPANFFVAAAALFLVFQGKPLGATTTTVVVEDEEGESVERIVPKSEFRRHVALFYFDNESGDPDLDWLRVGIPEGLWADLRQDLYIDARAGLLLSEALKDASRTDGLGVPLALKGTISREQNVEYFVAGAIDRDPDGLRASTALYEVDGNRLVHDRSFVATGPLELIDQISAQLRRDLGIPSARLEETQDLPISELLTDSEAAFRAFVEIVPAMAFAGDYERAIDLAGRAVEEDPTFAFAHYLRYAALAFANRAAEGREALEAALEHSYKLPQRERLWVKREYYMLRQQPERSLAVAEMAAEMFPDDVESLQVLAIYYSINDRDEDAAATFLRILETDPSRRETLLQLGRLYESLGRYEDALEYLGRYNELYPEDVKAYPMLASAHRATGGHDEARAVCERALLRDPRDVPSHLCVARVEADVGRWDEARAAFDEALESTATANERAQVHGALLGYQQLRGRMSEALRARASLLASLAEAGLPPVVRLRVRMETLDTFVRAGRPRTAIDSVRVIGAEFGPPFDLVAGIGEIEVYTELGDADALQAAIAKAEAMIESLGFETFRANVTFARGRLAELRGDCEGALPLYDRALELDPTASRWRTSAARCLRALGRLDQAAAELDEALRSRPFAPEALVELARVEIDRGSRDAAVAHLEKALLVWAEADAGYQPAEDARAALAALRGP